MLTNADWRASESDLDVLLFIVNDLEAVALSMPLLTAETLPVVAGARGIAERVLCLGIGTGFGGALYTPDEVIAMEPDMSHYGGDFGRPDRRVGCVRPRPRSPLRR